MGFLCVNNLHTLEGKTLNRMLKNNLLEWWLMGFFFPQSFLHLQQTHHDGCVEEASLCVSRSNTAKYREEPGCVTLSALSLRRTETEFCRNQNLLGVHYSNSPFIHLSIKTSIPPNRNTVYVSESQDLSWKAKQYKEENHRKKVIKDWKSRLE